MGYLRPCGDIYVPSSWADHKYRNPPSSEPGTDYAAAYGTPIACADPGTVTDVNPSNSYATGRYVTVALDDGRTVRYLHMSATYVSKGYRVGRGAILGASGASGNGSDYYYGAHVHTTLWPGAIWAADTIDFELYVGDDPVPAPEPKPEPIPEWMETEMDYYARGSDDTSGRIWKMDMDAKVKRQLTPSEWTVAQGAYAAMKVPTPLATNATSKQLSAFANVEAPPPPSSATLSATRTLVTVLVALLGLLIVVGVVAVVYLAQLQADAADGVAMAVQSLLSS